MGLLKRPWQRSARPRSRRAAPVPALLLAVLASLLQAQVARAQLEDFPVVNQVAGQASEAVQTAGAQAASLQDRPANVAIQILVNSPGSKPAISQVNEATAATVAANANATKQAAGQLQGGEPSESVSSGQAVGQAAQSAQDAAAQAEAAQSQATNLALSVVVNSPGATPAVNQLNSVASHAGATNSNSTAQIAAQAQPVATALPAQAANAPPPGGAASSPESPGGAPHAGLVQEILAGIAGTGSPVWIWIWDWDWIWNSAPPAAEPPQIDPPPLQVPAIPPPGWSLPEIEMDVLSDAAALADVELPATLAALPVLSAFAEWAVWPAALDLQPDDGASAAATTGRLDVRPAKVGRDGALAFITPRLDAVLDESGANDLSSSFVQKRTRTGKTAPAKFKSADGPLSPPGRSVPGGSAGTAFSSAGLALGALFLLALQLASAASAFGRRFDLASAAWRRQAYLSPLERPG